MYYMPICITCNKLIDLCNLLQYVLHASSQSIFLCDAHKIVFLLP